MSETNRPRTTDRASIPPIEIGSFIALRPDKSEFIGSASGVFFANTVFRAFDAASSWPAADVGDNVGASDPGSAHSYLVAPESGPGQVVDGDDEDILLAQIAPNVDADASDVRSYGLTATGLGTAPSPDAAQKLVMLYFRNWHPFFPFLHGPTFVDQVNSFYEKGSGSQPGASPSLRSRVLTAVTFQCIFNITGSSQTGQQYLDQSSRIQSVSSLTNLLGIISKSHDLASLQALLAVELYLMTRMSLRAASTVHGTLTRILYHSGFHRCPYRYVQLSQEMRGIRQRIFWCAYVLDRHLSQVLGHPVAIKDDELDVCIPGMIELHKPVGSREQALAAHNASGDHVRAHLPRTPTKRGRPEDDVITPQFDDQTTLGGSSGVGMQSPAHHHKTPPDQVGEYVLGYLATYSRLVGIALHLFHKSIHNRSITHEKVVELTCQIHSWWNSLPPALQDDDNAAGSRPQYSAFFAVAYHYLLIFINRPFLSLPTNRMDFQSSMQSAVSASRAIIRTLRAPQELPMLLHWPGALSATWMSGLVVAYASLLDLYPLEKSASEITACSVLFENMGSRWASARHCQTALKALLGRLRLRSSAQPNLSPTPASRADQDGAEGLANEPSIYPSYQLTSDEPQSNKRQKMSGETGTHAQRHSHTQGLNPTPGAYVGAPIWQPVLEYTGPDFGFDADQLADRGEWQGFLHQNLNGETGGFFDIAGWDAYLQGFGDRQNL